jgi:hypothetical protein
LDKLIVERKRPARFAMPPLITAIAFVSDEAIATKALKWLETTSLDETPRFRDRRGFKSLAPDQSSESQ